MALKWLFRPTNRRMRYLVGIFLAGLFCIQCIPSSQNDQGSVVIARSQTVNPEDVARKVLQLAQTDQVALLEYYQKNYEHSYRDYTCTFLKKERLSGALQAEQEVQVKFSESPFRVAMHWVRNAPIGDRVLYVEGKYNGHMVVRPASGLLRMLAGGAVFRKPDGADVMKNTLRPVNLFGFHRGMRELLGVYRQAKAAGDLKQTCGGIAMVDGRRAVVLERYLPPKDDYPAWKTVVYIDLEYLVPICIEGFDWDERLSSRYAYRNVRFNTGLTPDDFLPEANEITLTAKK